MNLRSLFGGRTTWTVTIDGTEWTLEGLTAEQFERFVSEYIEHDIKKSAFELFAVRWIEADAGERLLRDGELYYPESDIDD